MGEARRRMEMGLMPQPQQIQVDLKNATPRLCACGSKYFTPVVQVFTVSALLSPTGQELMAQVPALLCKDCGTVLELRQGTPNDR